MKAADWGVLCKTCGNYTKRLGASVLDDRGRFVRFRYNDGAGPYCSDECAHGAFPCSPVVAT